MRRCTLWKSLYTKLIRNYYTIIYIIKIFNKINWDAMIEKRKKVNKQLWTTQPLTYWKGNAMEKNLYFVLRDTITHRHTPGPTVANTSFTIQYLTTCDKQFLPIGCPLSTYPKTRNGRNKIEKRRKKKWFRWCTINACCDIPQFHFLLYIFLPRNLFYEFQNIHLHMCFIILIYEKIIIYSC